jgi:hypothetical protein
MLFFLHVVCIMQCKLGGPGSLSYFPQCLLPPIMRLRVCVYEGVTLIVCMCMQCKEAQDLVLLTTMPPPTLRVEFLRELI